MSYYQHRHYSPDRGFAPVDPFKPSIEYSLRNIWSADTHTVQPDLGDAPSSSSSPPYYYRHRRGHESPVTVHRRRSPSPSPRRHRRHRHQYPLPLPVLVQPPPTVLVPHNRRSRTPSSTAGPHHEQAHSPEPALQNEPITVVQPQSPSRRSSINSRRSHSTPELTQAAHARPSTIQHQTPSNESSEDQRSEDQPVSPTRPTIIVRHRSTSRRRRGRSEQQISSSEFSQRSQSTRSPTPILVTQSEGSIPSRLASASLQDSQRRRSRRRSWSRSRSDSLNYLPVISQPIKTSTENLSPSRSRRRRVRVYTPSYRSRSPETAWSIPTSAAEKVLPSAFHLPPPPSRPSRYSAPLSAGGKGIPVKAYILAFALDTLPRQIYLHLLLRLPYLYFTRVIRILEEANMSLPQIKQSLLDAAQQNVSSGPTYPVIQYENLERTWGLFIDSLIKEWKTLNIISVLLLSTILAIINMTQATNNDPLIRFPALISMIAALLSLICGCMYTIRFQTMRKGYKAIEWADECESTKTAIFWNVWVFLAMPATWLAWSLLLFVVCLIAFIWRSDQQVSGLSPHQALVPRIIASGIFGVGFVYLVLIVFTLRRYGSMMDQKWKTRVKRWLDASGSDYTWVQPLMPYEAGVPPYTSRYGPLRPGPSMTAYPMRFPPPPLALAAPPHNVSSWPSWTERVRIPPPYPARSRRTMSETPPPLTTQRSRSVRAGRTRSRHVRPGSGS